MPHKARKMDTQKGQSTSSVSLSRSCPPSGICQTGFAVDPSATISLGQEGQNSKGEEPQETLKTGYLEVKIFLKGWQRRWFVLKKPTFSYFRSSMATKPSSKIHARCCRPCVSKHPTRCSTSLLWVPHVQMLFTYSVLLVGWSLIFFSLTDVLQLRGCCTSIDAHKGFHVYQTSPPRNSFHCFAATSQLQKDWLDALESAGVRQEHVQPSSVRSLKEVCYQRSAEP